jgi:hypothetical protein
MAQQVGVRAGCGEGEVDASDGLSDAGSELEQPQPDRGELGFGEAMGGRDVVSHGEHQPIGCGVQHESWRSIPHPADP